MFDIGVYIAFPVRELTEDIDVPRSNTKAALTEELTSLLRSWEIVKPLTKIEAFEILTSEIVSGYTDDDGNQVEFKLAELEIEERSIKLPFSETEPLSELERLQEAWAGCQISGIEWVADLDNCGQLTRTCAAISRVLAGRRHRWYVRLDGECDSMQDGTFGPMW